MPSNLTSQVRNVISSLLKQGKEEEGNDLPIDVLRTLVHESSMLFEKQKIVDAFDSDAMGIFGNGDDDDDDDADSGKNENSDEADQYDVHVRKQLDRIKNLTQVLACDRCTTQEGYSSISATIEIKKDDIMEIVEDNLKLYFTFIRKPVPIVAEENDDDEMTIPQECGKRKRNETKESSSGAPSVSTTASTATKYETAISYTIALSRDHGPKEDLVQIEVEAPGDSPSLERAVPMDTLLQELGFDNDESLCGEDGCNFDEFDENGNLVQQVKACCSDKNCSDKKNCAEMIVDRKESKGVEDNSEVKPCCSDKNCTDKKNCTDIIIGSKSNKADKDDNDEKKSDRFAAYVDPEVLENFLTWSKVEMSGEHLMLFFMTFPFYEVEWDLVGFLLHSIFGDGEDDDLSSCQDE